MITAEICPHAFVLTAKTPIIFLMADKGGEVVMGGVGGVGWGGGGGGGKAVVHNVMRRVMGDTAGRL